MPSVAEDPSTPIIVSKELASFKQRKKFKLPIGPFNPIISPAAAFGKKTRLSEPIQVLIEHEPNRQFNALI